MKRIGIFLKWILCFIVFFLMGALCTAKKASVIIMEKQKNLEKHIKLFLTLDAWIRKKQQGKSIVTFLKKNTYHSVAIYGLSNIGKLLEEELKGHVEISYGIDRKEISAEFPVYRPEDNLPETDVVIVTPAYEFEEIEEALKQKLKCPIYSIEDIIYFMD